jgi:predicted RecA/RadA family phage recombinase
LLFLTLSVSAQTTPQRQIVSELSLCVEVAGASQDDGASIFQGNCNDGNKHQVFDFIPASGTDNAYHQIRASHSNKCLGVADGALAPGADIVQLSCVDNDPATLWKQRDGVLILQHSGYCLSVDASSRSTSGAFMVQWFCDSPSVKWQVKTVSEQYDGLQQLLKRSNFARRSESGFYLSTGTTHDNQFLTTNSSWSETETDGATYSGCGSYGQDTFNRHRTGPAFVFTIPGFVAGDTYDVTMGFAEMWVPQCQDGKRIMNITVNGRTFAQDLDVYNAAGGCRTALILTKSFEASSRGEFVIDFTSTIHNPMVSFIQIQHVGANAMQARMLADVPTASPNLSIEPTIARATNVSTIVSEGFSGLCVDILGGSVSDGAQAVQASCNGGDSQEYQFLIVGEGQFQVVASHSQKCLGVADLDVTDSADVIQLPCTSNTLWYVVGGGAYLQLRVLHSAKCLSIFGASIAPGTKLVQEACDEGPDQLWRVADGLFAEETLEPSASAAPSPSPSVSFEPTRAGAGKGPPAPTIQPTLSNAPSSMPSLSALRGSSPPSQQPSQTVSVSPSVSVEPTIAPGPPLFYLKTGTNQDLAYISGDNLGVYSKPGAQILGAGRYGEATFRSHRWGNTFVITIPGFSVGDMYTISLGFAEIYFCAEGKRVMTITVNDEVFEADLDVVAAAGACNTALVMRKDFAANSDGAFAIAFFSPINNAMVSFVEIDLAGTLSPTFSPAPSFAPTFSSAPTESSEVPSLAPSTSVSPSTSPTSSAEPTVAPEPNPWEGEYAMSLVAVAAANLDDGRILAWSAWSRTHYARSVGKTFISIFDPATNESTEGEITNTNHDMFCPGTATLGDGRIMITGGSNAASVTFFDPSANSWYRGPPMKIPRGYHSMTVLGDGSVFTLGGSWSGTGRGNRGGEVWSPTGGWVLKSNILIPGSSSLLTNDVGGVFRSDNHMWLFTAPNGKVFHAGPSKRMHWIDVAGEGEISDSLLRGNDNDAMNGNAVMFDIGKIFTVGGAPNYEYGDNEGTKLAHVIDINAGEGSETVQRVGDMAFARTLANSVGLPSGEVIVIGGQTKVFLFTDREAVFAAEIWSPNTGQFTTLAEMKIPRTYHSVAILMKDGRVWAAGGGLCGNCPTNHKDAEILTPPYLLNEDGSLKTRPVIQSSPSRLVPGETINVSVDTSGNHNFVLMRISAVTHSVNNDQRRIPLTNVGGDNNSFQLIAPDNYNVTVPGTYFLFAMNADGVPSVGKTIVVDAPDGPQPDPPLIFPIESADFSGLCVNIGSNSFENGAQATQFTCNENANQQFDFQSAEGGLYRIVAFHSQKCLTVTQGSMGEGANIVQQPCDDFSHQLWTVTGSGSDQQLKASHSGKCLSIFESSIAIGAILVQLECNEEPAQLWRIDDRLTSSQTEAPSLSNPPSLAPSVSSAPAVASASLPPTIAPAPPIFSLRTGSPLDLPYISAGGPASKTYQDPTPSAISGAGEYGDATFQRHRWGNTFTFTIPGFVAGNTYAVTLGFAELYFCAASSSRTMTISINGESFATNLDVFGAAGGCNSALLLTQEFSANSAGAFVIAFASPIENAMISLIEVRSDSGPPLPSESIQPSQGPTVSPGTTLSLQPSSVPALSAEPTGMSAQPSVTPSPVLLGESAQPTRSPSDTLAPNGASLFPTTTPAAPIFSLRTGSPLDLPYISAGGPASKTYQDPTPSAISGAGEYGDATFQRHRWGNTFTFTIPGFVAGSTYAVTLGFAEVYFCAASSSRTMTISVNGESFATNLDVFGTAGGCNSALLLTQEFSANSAGAFVIAFASPIENAMISLIEVRSDAGPPLPNESVQLPQGPTVSPGTTLSLQPSSVPMLSAEPTDASVPPSVAPSVLGEPAQPVTIPSIIPSSVGQPSGSPLDEQSRTPSVIPSSSPSFTVSRGSSLTPSAGSSLTPSAGSSLTPSTGSSLTPSTGPSLTPSTGPSLTPSLFPISLPSTTPSRSPTLERSPTPSTTPSNSPSLQLSEEPSASPLVAQSRNPSTVPSLSPSSGPESSIRPSEGPSSTPSSGPVSSPSTTPSRSPAGEPSIVPSITPSTSPSAVPSTTQVTTAVPTIATPGEAWTIQSSAANNNWTTVIYGNGTFVAVAATGIGNRIMTSPYGSTWTTRASAADNDWNGLTFGDGIFVAVASTGLGNRVMTSPDGIAWASRPSAADNNWTAVAYGNGMFVAVAASGIGDRIMTSPDGITWTLRGNAVDNEWRSVTYGDGTFVAVASTGIGNRVMTSPDGIQWTIQTSAADNWWSAVTYGDGTFVAVAATGTGDRVMTSPDGITWTTETSAPDMDWRSVTYGDGMFVAVASTGIGNRVMTSPDSVTWTSQASANDNDWHSVTYGNTTFVAVSKTGIGNRVMTSG